MTTSNPLPQTLSARGVRGHTAMPYPWGVEPAGDRASWPEVPEGCTREAGSVWGLCLPRNYGWGTPRARNDIAHICESEYVPINPGTRRPDGKPGRWLALHERRFLNHVFTPRIRGTGVQRYLPYRLAIYSDLKKSGKTALAAAITWSWARTYGGEIYHLANSLAQSQDRAFTRLDLFLQHVRRENARRYDELVEAHTATEISLRETDVYPYARIRILPVAAGTSAGGMPSLVVWDELWSYDRTECNRLWAEMQPVSAIPHRVLRTPPYMRSVTVHSPCMHMVVTYAGYHGESQLLWELYEATVAPDQATGEPTGHKADGLEDLPVYVSTDARSIAYWNQDVPRMPWQTPDYYRDAYNQPGIHAEELTRLHRNRWTSATGSYVDMGWIDAAAAAGEAAGLRNQWQ